MINTSETTKELVKMELLIFRRYQLDVKVNAWYSGSIIHVQSPTNLPKSM
jgi:hypothetical protein